MGVNSVSKQADKGDISWGGSRKRVQRLRCGKKRARANQVYGYIDIYDVRRKFSARLWHR